MTDIENLLFENTTYLSETVQFQLGEKSWFNEEEDNDLLDQPLFLVDHYIRTKLTYTKFGQYTPTHMITILLLDEHEQDESTSHELFEDPGLDLERNTIVKRMRNLAKEFVAALSADTRLSAFKDKMTAEFVAVYNVFDSNLDGGMLTISLQQQEDTICVPKHSGPNI